MKIIIGNYKFPFDIGCKMLKTKYLKYDKCPIKDDALQELWNNIPEITFEEISKFTNVEERRIAFVCYGIERLIKQVKPKLIDRKIIQKENSYIDGEGNLIKKVINDKYELYKVDGKHLGNNSWGRQADDCHYIRCWCTSTGREYLIWIDGKSVSMTNKSISFWESKTTEDAIEAIAWTFTTDVKPEAIEKIIRQGDCILFKIKSTFERDYKGQIRHLTKKEYLEKLTMES